jgi:hypothetical protein
MGVGAVVMLVGYMVPVRWVCATGVYKYGYTRLCRSASVANRNREPRIAPETKHPWLDELHGSGFCFKNCHEYLSQMMVYLKHPHYPPAGVSESNRKAPPTSADVGGFGRHSLVQSRQRFRGPTSEVVDNDNHCWLHAS